MFLHHNLCITIPYYFSLLVTVLSVGNLISNPVIGLYTYFFKRKIYPTFFNNIDSISFIEREFVCVLCVIGVETSALRQGGLRFGCCGGFRSSGPGGWALCAGPLPLEVPLNSVERTGQLQHVSYVHVHIYHILRIFCVGKLCRKWSFGCVLNFHRVLFSLFQGLSMKTYSGVYFLLRLFLGISGRLRTQRKLNPREKYPIYGMMMMIYGGMKYRKQTCKYINIQALHSGFIRWS